MQATPTTSSITVHLVDGTYELFRQHFGQVSRHGSAGPNDAAIGVVGSTLQLIANGATHVGVASDHVIESFRNDLYAGYKTSAGMDPVLLHQIPVMEEALIACGFTTWPMVEWVLDQRYAHLHHAEDYVEQAITIWDTYEGQLIGMMQQITADFPGATLFSLPTLAAQGQRRSLELGMKGTAASVAAAMALIKADIDARGLEWQDKI